MSEGGTYFLCRHSEAEKLVEEAEKEKRQILEEFSTFYRGNVDIVVYPVRHVMGTSIAGELRINGETVREYDPVDLCFLDLNMLMMKRLIEARS